MPDVVGTEFSQDMYSIEKAERPIGRPVVQLFPSIEVNRIHHQADALLLKAIEKGG